MIDAKELFSKNAKAAERFRHLSVGQGVTPELARIQAKAHAVETVGVIFQENLDDIEKGQLDAAVSKIKRLVNILIESADNASLESDKELSPEEKFRAATAKGHIEGYKLSLSYLSEELQHFRRH